MITYTSKIENNQFKVTWDFAPKNLSCSRGNYTAVHKGAGTTSRQGIWEGIELESVEIKIGSNPWTSYGKNTKVSVSTNDNNVEFLAKAKYKLKTMGYHFQCTDGSIPFFFYGNVGGVTYKYAHGSFRDANPQTPSSNLHAIHAIVPKDWSHVGTSWSDWAYKHGQSTSNWVFDNGRYEQRNGNTTSATTSNGWISDSNYKQAWRKSCLFTFEKTYSYSGVISSGIVKDASTPVLTVSPSKGDSGKITIKYVDANNTKGGVKIVAYCQDRQGIVKDYSEEFTNGKTVDYTVDFVKLFGESYRGNNVTYEAWAKNTYEKISPSTGKKSGHRFNGRPSIPTGLAVKGKNDIIYNDLTFSWNAATDPEGDSITYDLWLKAIRADNSIIRDDYIVKGYLGGTNYDYNIANHPDDTSYILKVRSNDGLITSDWSNDINFKKGSKPKGIIVMSYPSANNTNLYSDSPRFVFSGYDLQSIFVVECNGVIYNTKDNSDLFDVQNDKVIFKNNFSNTTSFKLIAYLQNEYGISEKSLEYKFTKKSANNNIEIDKYIYANYIRELQNLILDKAKTYGVTSNIEMAIKDNKLTVNTYNDCITVLKAINSILNSIITNSKFNVSMISNKCDANSCIDNTYWDNLLIDIKNI